MSNRGDMLRLARQRKGFTQQAAADKLDVSQPVLSRFENGLAEPDDAALIKASLVYDIPRQFFDLTETVYGPAVSVHPMPRAKASVTARELEMVTAELNIRSMQLRKFLEGVDYKPTRDLPKFDVESFGTPVQIAALLRAHWGVPSGPIKNLTSLVESAGAVVGHSDFGGAGVSGMTFKVPGSPPLILLNRQHPADRLRLTLAHELGHVIMHRFPTPDMEREAFEFASALLMPPAELQPYFLGRKPSLELLAAMKPELQVSMAAILYAAQREQFITRNQFRYLMTQISQRGWRMREPPSLDFPREQPKIMATIIKAHVRQLGFTIEDLCNFIPMHQHEFDTLYEGDTDGGAERGPRLRIVN